MNCYFDTSIYNQLLDDNDKRAVIAGLKERQITAIPSIVNLCEILQTPDEGRKSALLEIYEQVRNDYHALKPFTTLLKDAVHAIQRGETYVVVNMPIAINRENEILCEEALKNKGAGFEAYTKSARDWVINENEDFGELDSKSFFELAHNSSMNPIWLELFVGACRSLGIEELALDEDTIISIMKDPKSPWKYYLDTTLLLFYRKAIRAEGYGRKSNPGGADLEQGIYLSWADMFVLQDGVFYEFMTELRAALGYQKEIVDYSEFKSFLGISIKVK